MLNPKFKFRHKQVIPSTENATWASGARVPSKFLSESSSPSKSKNDNSEKQVKGNGKY